MPLSGVVCFLACVFAAARMSLSDLPFSATIKNSSIGLEGFSGVPCFGDSTCKQSKTMMKVVKIFIVLSIESLESCERLGFAGSNVATS